MTNTVLLFLCAVGLTGQCCFSQPPPRFPLSGTRRRPQKDVILVRTGATRLSVGNNAFPRRNSSPSFRTRELVQRITDFSLLVSYEITLISVYSQRVHGPGQGNGNRDSMLRAFFFLPPPFQYGILIFHSVRLSDGIRPVVCANEKRENRFLKFASRHILYRTQVLINTPPWSGAQTCVYTKYARVR